MHLTLKGAEFFQGGKPVRNTVKVTHTSTEPQQNNKYITHTSLNVWSSQSLFHISLPQKKRKRQQNAGPQRKCDGKHTAAMKGTVQTALIQKY